MNDGNTQKQAQAMSNMKAALLGAAVGVGAAAAMAMTHKPTREKVITTLDTWGNKVDNWKEQGQQKMNELATKAREAREDAVEEAQNATKRAKKAAEDVLQS